jgi:hypothetical protein
MPHIKHLLAAACILGLLTALPARAQILDDIEIRADHGIAEVRIGFNLPMRYQKHFPAEHGEILRISFQAIALEDPDILRRNEYKKSPPTGLIPAFTITYNYQGSCYAIRDPVCLVIQFDKPVSYKVRVGEDDRNFYLYIPIEPKQTDTPPAAAKP